MNKLPKLLQLMLAPFFVFADKDEGGGAIDRGDFLEGEGEDDTAVAEAAEAEAAEADVAAEAESIEAEAAAAKDEPADDKSKAAMIPVSRHKAMLDKAREERDAMAAQLAQYEKGKQVQETNQELKGLEDQVSAKETEYNTLMLDGEAEKATAVMREIRTLERQMSDAKADMKAQAATAIAVESIRYDAVVERLESAYPTLSPDHDDYDAETVADIMDLKVTYERKGMISYQALQKAVEKMMGVATRRQEAATSDKPRVDAEDLLKADRTKTATKRALETAVKTPPNAARVGLDGDKAGGGALTAEVAMKMSQDKFAQLNEETLSRLRGDIL